MSNMLKSRMSARKVAHYIYFSMLIIVIITVYGMSIFLYNNFYMAITQSDIIIILKKDLATETFNIEKFDNIIKGLEKKNTARPLSSSKSPF